jgi:hypothetical protein
VICSIVLLAGLSLGHVPAVADTPFVDQHGRVDRVSAHREHVVIAMVVSARRLREIRAWEKSLRGHYDDLHYIRIADVNETRAPSRSAVAEKLRKRVPEDVSILIDVDRRWFQELQLDTDHTNLLVFDGTGALRAMVRGKHSAARRDELFEAIDAVRARP